MTWSLRTAKGDANIDTVPPEALSRQLREGTGGFLEERRGVVKGALVGAASMGLISLFQMGIIKHLPEPPLFFFDADTVDASEEAYRWLSTPDAPIGLASYGATVVLAAMGGQDRARRSPWLPLLLIAKTGADAAQAAKLTKDQITKHGALCAWCLLAAGATFFSLYRALPEARAALQTLRDGAS